MSKNTVIHTCKSSHFKHLLPETKMHDISKLNRIFMGKLSKNLSNYYTFSYAFKSICITLNY